MEFLKFDGRTKVRRAYQKAIMAVFQNFAPAGRVAAAAT
jgi:hypothetical protein